MNVKERIKKYVKSIGITVVDFERSINVSNGYVNSISKNVGIDKINKILEIYPNINLEWLFSGKGKMDKDILISSVVSDVNPEYSKSEKTENVLINELKNQIDQQRSDIEWYRKELDRKNELIDTLLSGNISVSKKVG